MPSHWVPLDQVQGNVTPGFRKDFQAFLFFQFRKETFAGEPTSAAATRDVRAWLSKVVSTIASAEEVATYNRLYRLVKRRIAGADAPDGTVRRFARSTWVNVAFTSRGLAPLLRSEPWAAEHNPSPWLRAFGDGMCNRDEITGDSQKDIKDFVVRDCIRDSFDHLNVTMADQQPQLVHALVIVGADCELDLDREVRRQIAFATTNGLDRPLELRGASLGTGREPFGFADGISQPDPDDPLGGWESDGVQNVAPGEIIRGCVPEDGHPNLDVPLWERFGSYLVFRQLKQDVKTFWERAEGAARIMFQELVDAAQPGDEHASILKSPEPGRLSPGAEYAAALIIGRWPSGATLTTPPDPHDPKKFPHDPGRGQRASGAMAALAARDLASDPAGTTCPMFAHVRRANPRVPTTDLRADALSLHRIVRRGIPYDDGASKGIMFLAYQARIDEGYEVIQNLWANNPGFGRPPAGGENPGLDPLSVWSLRPNNNIIVPLRKGATAGTFAALPSARTVTARGGGYFFAPSLTALGLLARDGFRGEA